MNPRIIILFIFLILALYFVYPQPFNSGATIRSISRGSPAALAGLESPKHSLSLMAREKVIAINTAPKYIGKNQASSSMSAGSGLGSRPYSGPGLFRRKVVPTGTLIETVQEYNTITSNLTSNQTIAVYTNKARYELTTRVNGAEDLGINVYDAPTSNLIKGLDLQGGTRVLLKPERALSREESDSIIDVLKHRLNIYGLSDIVVREAKDLSLNQFILVEIAGANEKEVRELIEKQGKFEAKIANQTIFRGGNDITYVCKTSRCSGVNRGCTKSNSTSWTCGYGFSIALSAEAAQRQADVTTDLEIIKDNNSREYLSEKLELYLDDEFVNDLSIGAALKGRPVTGISISGSGNGTSRKEAMANALENMKEMQTVLTTGSLPVKLEIAKADSLSPLMGQQFSRNSLYVGLISILAVILIVFTRYRQWNIALPMILSMLSELIIILGVAAFIKWNLDLVAIAGIVVAIGTGVDDLIVMSDEVMDKENHHVGWEAKRKKAFFIIMAAYFTTVVAMVPLLFAGAGLLRGFALTTMIGITAGVFIVRPAFAAAIKILVEDKI